MNDNISRQIQLTAREKYSYGAGEIASNLAWNMATGFLLVYYTDVAMLPVAALGTLMLVTRILDAIFDPLVGIMVDRTKSRFGKARPYLIYAAVPFGVLFVATFSIPAVSPTAKLVYAYVTFALLGLCYSLLYVPYSSMLPMMTRNTNEKVQLGSFRAMGTSLASIVAYGLAMPMVAYFGGTDRQWGFTVAAAIMAVATCVLYFVVFFNCRERYTASTPASTSITATFGQMIRNPVWRVVFALGLLVFIRIGVMVSSLAFFAKDVMQQTWVVSVILPLMSVMIFIGGFISRPFLARFGKRLGCNIGLAASILLIPLLYVFESNPVMFIAVFVLSNVAGGIQAATIFVLSADAVEWQEKNFGQSDEGLMAASVSFGLKVGIAIGTAITAYTLGMAGYKPGVVTESANLALRVLTYGGPIVLMVLMMICISFYREDDRVAKPGRNIKANLRGV
ncbi:glycoside-pentoside-hexuronide (GPH):cation symporter [Telluria mixta]|uniref:Glycoside-pentoside-hexuronide (GPH):cation symporter n=1 Tax=Telluria mixta TaxID=34071 RepID=A0ABT2C1F4_9BURK|nr:glycoside-pentoside-hexuronide (GPH):cation symporter [Telluria mixta]MCS0631211.1 glycoside-pentoside-hexuronide (GPH):cation symporter [Telluria mixta]WEM95750.1 glycoside-pentoside-hexuronide (GPH):cation symporter [Telluria mixta]